MTASEEQPGPAPRRLGAEGAHNRTRFVDAAEAILGEVGEQGISARLVAARAGLKTQLLYYYFLTMDDLLLAVVQRVNQRRLTRFEEALAAPDPLRALWDQMRDPTSAALASAITAVAKHREAVRSEITAAAETFRTMQGEAIARLLPPPGPGEIAYTPAGIVMIAAALARMLVNETSLGMGAGHAEALAIVEQLLERFAPRPEQDGDGSRGKGLTTGSRPKPAQPGTPLDVKAAGDSPRTPPA
ncbi:MAG: TetR/AcrR family transcriptional regulator [Novosphingobium sp.]